MRLPNAESCSVAREKVVGYLLSETHPDGASKAKFFREFGFRPEDWQAFADALCQHGREHAMANVVESVHGIRYTVDGALRTPSGQSPMVRTVWVVEGGGRGPRLITAHPLRGQR